MADAQGANNLTTLDGLFKNTYADKMEKLVPEDAILQEMVKFLAKDKQPGLQYNAPVILGLEHGVTYADDEDGAFELNAAVPGQIKNATIKGYQILLRSVLPYVSAFRSATNAAAFQEGTKFLVGNMLDSVTKKVETSLMRGSIGLGVVGASASATSHTLTVDAKDWAPGVFGGAEGMKIQMLEGAALATNTRIPSGGTLNTQELTITAVDFANKQITVTTSPAMAIVASSVIFEKGAHEKQMKGLHAVIGQQSGVLFGINQSVSALWKSNIYDAAGSVLSFAILQEAIAKGVEKGLKGDVKVLVNPGHWDDLLTEQAAQRMYDSSYKSDTAENGAKSIKFYSQAGMVEIRPSIYVSEGFAYIIKPEDWARVGSTDITFKRPGQSDQFFRDLVDHAGFELRCYTDQALFTVKPAHQVLICNLVAS